MSRVATDLGHKPTRRHAKQWDAAGTAAGSTNAVGTLAPTGLGLKVAMGSSGSDGMVTVIIDGTAANADVDLTFYTWNETVLDAAGLPGEWVALGANSNINTATFSERCQGSVKIPENVPWFVKGSIVCTDLYSDCRKHKMNEAG